MKSFRQFLEQALTPAHLQPKVGDWVGGPDPRKKKDKPMAGTGGDKGPTPPPSLYPSKPPTVPPPWIPRLDPKD